MHSKFKKVLLILFSALFVFSCVAFSACSSCDDDDSSDGYNGLFAGDGHDYELTGDYTLSDADVRNTEGSDSVTLNCVCTFNLGGHTLNLGGYTLNIASDSKEVVKFRNGKIKNGKLNISVPNGDIEFTGTDIDETVTYDLEAASETIRFSNAVLSGKCTVKSNTHVSVEYSAVGDITLAGNGSLTAGDGAELGAVKIGESASGATVSIASSASVSNMELHAAANVQVEGSVSSVTVAETAKNDASELSINIAETASVDKVELNAAAKVSVAGSVSSVKVAESAKNDSAALSIDIAETASVDKVELNAAASVSVAGSVQAVTVAESAKNDSAALSISVASTAEVARVELNAPASVEIGGGVSNIVVANTAGGSSVKLTETASVATVAVNAGNTKIDSAANASVSQVVVAESVKDSVNSNVEVTTVTATEMEEYLKHQHIFVITSRVPATCTEAGKVIKSCDCGETKEETVPALGHKYVYSLIKEPTADAAGVGLYHCIRCGDEYTVDVENNVSVVIKGLESVFALIPNGTYTLSVDKANPVTVTEEDGFTAVLKEADAVVVADNGSLSGTFSGAFTMKESAKESFDVTFKAVLDGTQVFADYTFKNEYDGSSSTESGFVYQSFSAAIKAGLSRILPFDVEKLSDILPYLENIHNSDTDGSLDILSKIVDGITVKTTQDGNTVYTFDSEKFLASLNALGEKTLDKVIDDVFGAGLYADIVEFTNGIADKTVQSATLSLFALTEKYGLPKETLIEIAQKVINIVLPEEEIDVNELVTGYLNKTVKAVVAEFMGEGTTEAQAKQQIEQLVQSGLNFCTETTVADAVNLLIEKIASRDDGGFDKPSGDIGKPTLPDDKPTLPDQGEDSTPALPDGKEPLALSEEEGLNYSSIVEMISAYAGNVTASATLNSENRLVAFEISYLDESGIKVSIKKTADSLIPVIDVDVMGVKVNVDKTETGVKASAEAMGMTFALIADETQTGANVNFTMVAEEETVADIDVIITAKKDALNNVNGAQFEVNGDLNIDKSSITVSGKFTAEKNDNAKLDDSVWNSFDGDKSAFYHMNVAFIENYDNIRLKYVNDDTGEYYLLTKTTFYPSSMLSIVERVYTARLLSIEGLPEIMFICEDDCKDWVNLTLSYTGVAEVTETEHKGGTVKIVNGLYTVINSVKGETENVGVRSTEFYMSCYYNVKSGKVSDKSMHEYTYTGSYLNGGKQCNDGIKVTKTCSVCNHSETEVRKGHYNIEKETVLKTQCGEASRLIESECVVCHSKSVRTSVYEHNMHGVEKIIVPDADYDDKMEGNCYKLSELTNLGFDTAGFYHGELMLRHCSVCGLNVYEFTYYTNTTAKGCLRHSAFVVEYKGNSGFEEFLYKTEVSSVGHYTTNKRVTFNSVDDAIAEVEAVIGEKLLFAHDEASGWENRCASCNKLVSRNISMYSNGGGKTDLYTYYVDGQLSSWNYHSETTELQVVLAQAAKYDATLTGATGGNVYYSLNSSGSDNRIRLRMFDDADSTLELEINLTNKTGYKHITNYVRSQCKDVVERYKMNAEGGWTLEDTFSREHHSYVNELRHGDNCREDGYYYFHGCSVCGDGTDKPDIIYSHSDLVYHSAHEEDVQRYAELFTDNSLSGLEATVSFDNICGGCNTAINVIFVLQDNWVLQNDVYIKAEGIIVDLNGFVIDLNGYHLVIYSYAGEQLVLTDNSFDTSKVENYDPATFSDYSGRILNSKEDGVLIIVSREVLVGTIAIDCNVFASDEDDRYTLFNSFSAWEDEKGNKIGYELDILKDEKPDYLIP